MSHLYVLLYYMINILMYTYIYLYIYSIHILSYIILHYITLYYIILYYIIYVYIYIIIYIHIYIYIMSVGRIIMGQAAFSDNPNADTAWSDHRLIQVAGPCIRSQGTCAAAIPNNPPSTGSLPCSASSSAAWHANNQGSNFWPYTLVSLRKTLLRKFWNWLTL